MITLLNFILNTAIYVFAGAFACGLAELTIRIADKRRNKKSKPVPLKEGHQYMGWHIRDGEVASPGEYLVRTWHISNGKPVRCYEPDPRCQDAEHYRRIGQVKDAICKFNLDNSRSQSDMPVGDSG